MSAKKYLCIGKVQSAQGIKGDLFVLIFAGEAAWENKWKTLELGDKESSKPTQNLKILAKRAHSKQGKVGFAVKVDGVTDRNAAEELIGSRVFVPEEYMVSKKGESIYLREILNFEVTDKNRGVIGLITGFSDNGAQDIISIASPEGKVSEVPLVEPILESIDFAAKKVFMDIPEGLLFGEDE